MSADLSQPISADAPAGIDLSYEADFEPLANEIEKLTSLAAEAPNWHFIASESERMLCERSKDLRVLSWLVAARANLEGWSGIASGLAMYVAIAEAFWPTLYPPGKRPRARAGQVEWLWGVVGKRIAALPVAAADVATVRGLEPLIAAAASFFAEQLKDADPGVGALRVAYREKMKTLPEEAPVPPPSPPVAVAAPVVAVSSSPAALTPAPVVAAPVVAVAAPTVSAVAIDATSLANLVATLDAARKLRASLVTLAHHGRSVAQASPWSYGVLRFATWIAIERAPEPDSGKTTPLRAPDPRDRGILDQVRTSGNWDGLIEVAEEAAAENPFWLDPHRMTAVALEQKGPAFAEARRAVIRETLSFVERASGVVDLLFADGTRFASAETADWIAASRGAASAGKATTAPTESSLGDFEAKLQAASGPDALADLLGDAERLTAVRDRFRARLLVANHAQTGDQLDVALALYERLLPDVTPTLEAWEPALAADLIGNYLKICRRLFGTRERTTTEIDIQERKEALLFQRLLSLDPHVALRLRG